MKKVLLTLSITIMCLVLSMGSVFSAGSATNWEQTVKAEAQDQQGRISGPVDELGALHAQITALQDSSFKHTRTVEAQRKLLLKDIDIIIDMVERGDYHSAMNKLEKDFKNRITQLVIKDEQPKLLETINTAIVSIENASRTTVRTAYGKVAGADADNGSWIWAGIPYAKPPVGNLRWKAPQNPEPWDKIRHSTYNFSRCMQPMYDLQWNPINKIQGSEDCLYLNVYRPKTNEKNLPVYFYIHGGGHVFSGADDYNASILANKSNMVVVVIQFRIGPFGWFNHPSLNPDGTAEDKSGNYGTLDMIKALQWVKQNISGFGGNPDNVTIAGESTGGYHVMNLLISPQAKGLFHRAINESGGSYNRPVAAANEVVNGAIDKLLVTDGTCTDLTAAAAYRASMSNAQIEAYLRGKTAEEIERSVMTDFGAIYTITPILDGFVLPGTLESVFESGNYNHVPVIIGCNADEMRPFLPAWFAARQTSTGYTWFNALNAIGARSPSITLDQLMPPNDPDRELYDTCGKYSSLYWKAVAVDSLARLLKKHQEDVYCYQFKWGGIGSGPSPFDFLIGAGHTFDLPFFFGWDYDYFGNVCFTEANKKGRLDLQKDIMSYAASFAATGNPNKEGSGLPVWEKWSNNANEPKSIILDADYNQAKIHMMNEEYTREDIMNQINALPPAVRDMVKILLWI